MCTNVNELWSRIKGAKEWENKEWKEYFEKNKNKLEKAVFSEEFADQNIVNAFMFPAVQYTLESFVWGEYDSAKMEGFLRNHPSVNESRILTIVKPALTNQRKEKQLKYEMICSLSLELPTC